MKQSNKLWHGKKLRGAYDTNRKIWLVSAVDVIAAITNSNYDTARNYWKQFKLRLKKRNHSLVKKTRQLKFIAKDGLYRYTDVIDYKEIVKLIQALPYKVATKIKNRVGGMICKSNEFARDLTSCISEVRIPKEHCFIRYISVKKLL